MSAYPWGGYQYPPFPAAAYYPPPAYYGMYPSPYFYPDGSSSDSGGSRSPSVHSIRGRSGRRRHRSRSNYRSRDSRDKESKSKDTTQDKEKESLSPNKLAVEDDIDIRENSFALSKREDLVNDDNRD